MISKRIKKWIGTMGAEVAWERGSGEARRWGWLRADGERAIETIGGDPVFPTDLEFERAWNEGAHDPR